MHRRDRPDFLEDAGISLEELFADFPFPKFELEGWSAHGESGIRVNGRKKLFTLASVQLTTGRTTVGSNSWLSFARDLSPTPPAMFFLTPS